MPVFTKLLLLTGWTRAVWLCLCGALAALALAPFFVWPLLVPAYSILFWYVIGAPSARASFTYGWWWGFGFFVAGLYWIAIALTTDMQRFGWLIPFTVIGLNGALALFPALACLVFFYVRRVSPWANWLMLAVLLAGSEWLRGHILTGFPWNLIGYAWGASDASIQMAWLLDIYSLTLLTILLASLGYMLCARASGRLYGLGLGVAAVVAALAYGHWRVDSATPTGFDSLPSMRLVQANIAQNLKWDEAEFKRTIQTHIALSTQEGAKPDIIIWPESAYPYSVDLTQPLPLPLYEWLVPSQRLITGIVLFDGNRDNPRFWNSLIVVNANGEIIGRQDKHHLVPFGEYVPLRDWLPINKITYGMVDFTAAKAIEPVALAGSSYSFLSLICYEAIFSDYAQASNGYDFIVNVTNDGWFGQSAGPYQHATMARFRAVEQSKPLIRVANTGISAMYDSLGRLVKIMPLQHVGVIDSAN